MPESWDDITVKDQIRIANIAQEYTGLTAQLQLIAGYANIPVDVIKKTHINKLPTLVKHLEFITEDLVEEEIEGFEHNGHKYFLMPSLLNAEFQDFVSIEASIQNNKENKYEALPMMIAILAKREDETLDDYNLEERSKEFLTLPIKTANSISTFFLNLGMLSQLTTQISSEQIIQETEKELIRRFEELENILKQSDGGTWSGRFRKKMLLKYVMSLKKNFNLY